ncbi:MAG: TolC family protein [Spirochaetales bacterium]|nr:TolC family protein [Spirochaetales bacterium]
MLRNPVLLSILLLFSRVLSPGLEVDLGEAESLALSSSADLRHGREQLRLATLNRTLDIRAFLPQVALRYSDRYHRVLHGEDSESYSLVFDIRQPLFDGGRSHSARKLSAVQLELQAASLDAAIETVKDTLWRSFHQLLLTGEELRLQRELYDLSSEELKITRLKQELGSITEIDYLDAMMNLQGQEIGILETESRKKTQETAFLFLLGLDSRLTEDEELILRGDIDRQYPGLALSPEDRRIYEETALARNLDLRKQSAAILQAYSQRRLTRTSFIPAVNLEVSVSFSGDRLPMQDTGYSAGISLEVPWDPFPLSGSSELSVQGEHTRSNGLAGETSILPDIAYIGNYRTAELQLSRELSALEEMKKEISHNLSALLETHRQRRLALDLLRQRQELQKRKLQILEARNNLGEVPELTLLEARTDYYEGEISLGESVLDLLLCERELEQLLGLGIGELTHLVPRVSE